MHNKLKLHLLYNWSIFLASLALLYFYFVLSGGNVRVYSLGWLDLGLFLSIKIDFLSVLLLFMASFLTVSIGQYSVRYLSGEKRQYYFFKYLSIITSAVAVFLLSNNVLVIFFTWLLISYSLHKLLTYSSGRIEAKKAALKKLMVSRIGDIFLVSGLVGMYRKFGTFEIDQITAVISEIVKQSDYDPLVSFIALMFAFGAILKSVQFPFHFWLPETMETPTPVSALMHAGIVNAGGILVIKLSSLMSYSEITSALLVLSGAISAVFGSLVMITQNDIKKKLAYSTISQMGMMMFACGLQLYAVALFHIFAHSLYKAQAFLSTGELIEESKKIQCKYLTLPAHFILLISIIGGVIILLADSVYESVHLPNLLYFSILSMGMVNGLFVTGFKPNHMLALLKGLAIILIAIFIYFLIEILLHAQLNKSLFLSSASASKSGLHLYAGFFAYILFSIAWYLSNELLSPRSRFAKSLYLFFWNGGYLPLISSKYLEKILSSNYSKYFFLLRGSIKLKDSLIRSKNSNREIKVMP